MSPHNLKALRLSKGLSIQQAADMCEVAYATFTRWEQGRSPMPTAYALLFRTRANAHGDNPEEWRPWPSHKIAALRENLDLTQAALGQELGVSRTTVYLWECSQTTPTAANCLKLDTLKQTLATNVTRATEGPEGLDL